jgi:hypothetical protein
MPKAAKANGPRRSRRRPAINVIDRLLEHTNPSDAFFIEEPNLVFARGGLAVDPKTGIETHGPFELDQSGRSKLRVGIIGTGNGIQTGRSRCLSIIARRPFKTSPSPAPNTCARLVCKSAFAYGVSL